MPQPATHYLVTRRAIPKEHWEPWWDKYKPFFGLGSSAPDLFYFPLMPGVKGVNKDISWGDIASPLHSCRSYDMFCTLLSKAKQHKQINIIDAEKQFAFAFGYYCHVITDCIFHPYVYRSTGDHWASEDFANELVHKKQEFYIDTGIFQKFYDKTQNFSHIQWECPDSNCNLLNFSIARFFQEAINEIYPDSYPLSPDVTREDHPIQQAYSAFIQSISSLFEGTTIYLFGLRKVINTSAIRLESPADFFTTPYPECPTLDSYTPEELFNFSSVACRKAFLAALGFWESDAISAKDYFSAVPSHYLGRGNWNLDTGLPCQYNNYEPMRDDGLGHYFFKADELKHLYKVLKSESQEFLV